MLPGQMLLGQMTFWQLKFVQYGPRNLLLKFGQNWVSNSWDIAYIEFVWVGGRWMGGGLNSFYCQTQLRLCYFELRLIWGFDNIFWTNKIFASCICCILNFFTQNLLDLINFLNTIFCSIKKKFEQHFFNTNFFFSILNFFGTNFFWPSNFFYQFFCTKNSFLTKIFFITKFFHPKFTQDIIIYHLDNCCTDKCQGGFTLIMLLVNFVPNSRYIVKFLLIYFVKGWCCCQSQHKLNSTSTPIEAEIALIPFYPINHLATHAPTWGGWPGREGLKKRRII